MRNPIRDTRWQCAVWLLCALWGVAHAPISQANDALWRSALAASILATMAGNPLNADGLAIQAGQDTEDGDMTATTLNARFVHKPTLIQRGGYRLAGDTLIALGQWQHKAIDNTPQPRAHLRNNTLTLAYIFRHHWQPLSACFLEHRIGVVIGSAKTFGDQTFGSSLNFTNGWGIGYRYGRFAVRISHAHISNNDIAHPNPPVNITGVSVERLF